MSPTICEPEKDAETGKRRCHQQRAAKVRFDVVIEEQPDDANGNSAQQYRPSQVPIATVFASSCGSHPSARHRGELFAEVEDHRGECADVHGRIELKALILPTEEAWHQDQVTGARNRQELRDALDNRKNDGVKCCHVVLKIAVGL